MPKKKALLVLGKNSRKCQPRLRMIANANPKVNAVRPGDLPAHAFVTNELTENHGVERSLPCRLNLRN